MIQQLIVVLAVVAAVAYVAWSMAPSRMRFALLSRLDAALARGERAAGGGAGRALLRTRVLAPLLSRSLPAGGCGSCGSDRPPAAGLPRGPRSP